MIANSYFRAAIVAMFEEKHLDLMFHPDRPDANRRALEARLLDLLSASGKIAAAAIDAAIAGVNAELAVPLLPSTPCAIA